MNLTLSAPYSLKIEETVQPLKPLCRAKVAGGTRKGTQCTGKGELGVLIARELKTLEEGYL